MHDLLGLKASGVFEDVPKSEVTGIEIGDWHIVIANEEYLIPILKTNPKSLSTGCEVVCCFVEEHVMFSQAEGWNNKRESG